VDNERRTRHETLSDVEYSADLAARVANVYERAALVLATTSWL
jgi:hypothetical protein